MIRLGGLSLAGAASLAAFYVGAFRSLPSIPSAGGDRDSRPSFSWGSAPARRVPEGLDVSVLQPRQGTVSTDSSYAASPSRRFRLAGTFCVEDPIGGERRRAVLDERAKNVQHVVQEGAEVSGARVVRILADRVTLRQGTIEEELLLNFGASAAVAGAPGTPGTASGAGSEATDRFGGRRTGESMWLYRRQGLLGYYKELMDHPERLVKVFDSLQPVRDANSRITGYQVNILGEADFFASAGLSQGDIVRSVNSMPMTSRRRAEYLIGEFVSDRMNAFVLDVEREGKSSRLVYQIR